MVKRIWVALLPLLIACHGNSIDVADNSGNIQIATPPQFLQVRAIDRSRLSLEVTVNGNATNTYGNQPSELWRITINVPANSQNTVLLNWFDVIADDKLLLASKIVRFSSGSDPEELTIDNNYVTDGATLDADGDGVSNLAELNAGTDPRVADFAAVPVVEPTMLSIPAGCFDMGSPTAEPGHVSNERQHNVCVGAFDMGAFEVTYDEFDLYTQSIEQAPAHPETMARGRRPVVVVSWHEAVAYTRWLSTQTGRNYRLPTETEWEYAARAGISTPFNTGNSIDSEQANFDGSRAFNGSEPGVHIGSSVQVGSYAPNAFGLYDMHGNVNEWTCSDATPDYDGSENMCASLTGTDSAAVRGGDYDLPAESIRSAKRWFEAVANRDLTIGFRLVRN